ncbi:hypothetical protein ES703_35274 [subsurface metagenome]
MFVEKKDASGSIEKKYSRYSGLSGTDFWFDLRLDYFRLRFEHTPEAVAIKKRVQDAVDMLHNDIVDDVELAAELEVHYFWIQAELKKRHWTHEFDDEMFHRPQPGK